MALQTKHPVPGTPPAAAAVPRPKAHRFSALLHRSPNLRLAGLVTAPAGWLVLVYIAALAALLLIYEYFGTILISVLVVGVLVLTLQNLREALAPAGRRRLRKKNAPAGPAKG